MKRFLALALCALFACQAEARTLYVDASRPNNNGNGLSAKKAKKTIQAAVNIARAGDTILVAPGVYDPIQASNKKIAIKSSKGKSKTSIVMPARKAGTKAALAVLGKVLKGSYVAQSDFVGTDGSVQVAGRTYTWTAFPFSTGTDTSLAGFLLDGQYRGADGDEKNMLLGVSGGTVKDCVIRRIGSPNGYAFGFAAKDAKLTACRIEQNRFIGSATGLVDDCTANRCIISDNRGDSWQSWSELVSGSTLANTLIANNATDDIVVDSCVLLNCTIADNTMTPSYKGARFSCESKYYNCILRNNRHREPGTKKKKIHNIDAGNAYTNTNKADKDPKFTSEYKLKKGSHCIDAGALTAAQKKLVGSKDLAGNKRIRGKAIDRGCYEY